MFELEERIARQALRWFADQALETQLEVIQKKSKLTALQAASELDEFLDAILDVGFITELRFKRGQSISKHDAQKISVHRKRRAALHVPDARKKTEWLRLNWGKVVDLRRTGLSWRKISEQLEDEYGIKISHSALVKRWSNFVWS